MGVGGWRENPNFNLGIFEPQGGALLFQKCLNSI